MIASRYETKDQPGVFLRRKGHKLSGTTSESRSGFNVKTTVWKTDNAHNPEALGHTSYNYSHITTSNILKAFNSVPTESSRLFSVTLCNCNPAVYLLYICLIVSLCPFHRLMCLHRCDKDKLCPFIVLAD